MSHQYVSMVWWNVFVLLYSNDRSHILCKFNYQTIKTQASLFKEFPTTTIICLLPSPIMMDPNIIRSFFDQV